MPAPRKRIRAAKEEQTNMTPMIDVVFLLLIFFLLSLNFKKEESALRAMLPKSGYRPDQDTLDDFAEIRVYLRHPENLPVEAPTSFRVDNARYATLAEVENALHNMDRSHRIVIDAQQGVKFGDVVRVLDIGQRLRFSDVNFTAPHWFSKHARHGYEPVGK